LEVPLIKTSSWFVVPPPGHTRIGISRSAPRRQSGYRRYRALEPGAWFRSCTPQEFTQRYFDEVLGRLGPAQVVIDLDEIAGGDIALLLCWEPPPPNGEWCHRALVSAWLHDQLGIEVLELGHEQSGCGWQHPKLHPALKRG
jgi:hypothetical protein